MKLSVSFFLWKHRINARGTAPLYCRIILGDEIKQFSTALFLNPEDWSGTKQRVLSSHELAPLYNQTLSKLALTIEAKFLELKLMGKELSVGSLHPGSRKKLKTLTLLKAYDEYISRMQRLKGKKYALSTIQKFQQSQQHAQRAIANMKRKDLPLTFLKANFIDLFIETGLSHNYSLSTINKAIKNLKQIISYSIKNEYLDKDPFLGIRLTHDKKQIKFLTLDELQKMESVSLPNNKLEHARDCFIFSCYTGLAYTEAKALKFSDIYTDKEGRRWLKVSRQKTSKDYEIPLFPKALEIIEKYKPLGKL